MDMIKTLKEVLSFVQKSNDIEVTQKIISVQQEILNYQDEMSKLKAENEKLKSIKELEAKIARYKGKTYITLKGDNDNIWYCSRCWDKERKLVQVYENKPNVYYCPDRECGNHGEIYERYNTESTRRKHKCNIDKRDSVWNLFY